MMGPRQEAQPALFYEFSLEDHVPQDHLLRSIDRFVDLSSIRAYLADFYSHTGRPSVDPELLIRMLLVGYCFGIRSERRLCEELPRAGVRKFRCVSVCSSVIRLCLTGRRNRVAVRKRAGLCFFGAAVDKVFQRNNQPHVDKGHRREYGQ